MWNENRGFFFDYDYVNKRRSEFYSLAGFFPLWCRMATDEQARRMVRKLKKFEYDGGLATTQKSGLSNPFKQWDYPNGWAPMQWIVIKGLLNYGFEKDASRIAFNWLEMNKKVFLKTGKFWEKYDVVKNKIGKEGRYPIQTGFGWTNAIFLKLYKTFT